jgi:hypothetical protein
MKRTRREDFFIRYRSLVDGTFRDSAAGCVSSHRLTVIFRSGGPNYGGVLRPGGDNRPTRYSARGRATRCSTAIVAR